MKVILFLLLSQLMNGAMEPLAGSGDRCGAPILFFFFPSMNINASDGLSVISGIEDICCELCHNEDCCVGYTYIKDFRKCYLKHALLTMESNEDYFVSGSTSPLGGCDMLHHGKYYWQLMNNKMQILPDSNPTECCNKCHQIKECGVFSYSRNSGYCYLMHPIDLALREAPKIISGEILKEEMSKRTIKCAQHLASTNVADDRFQSATSTSAITTLRSSSAPSTNASYANELKDIINKINLEMESENLHAASLKLIDEVPKQPLNRVQKAVVDTAQNLGCIWIIGILGFTLATFVALRIWNYERVFHLNEELSLLLANLLLLFFRDHVGNKAICTTTSSILVYLYLVEMSFFLMEAIHVMSHKNNLISKKPLLSWAKIAVIGWASPALLLTVVSGMKYNDLPSRWSCWINYGDTAIAFTVTAATLALFVASLVIIEATNVDSPNLPIQSLKCDKQITICYLGLAVIVPLNVVAFGVGSVTVYFMQISLFTVAFALNISLGVAFWVFHTLSEEKVRIFIQTSIKRAYNFWSVIMMSRRN